ncbi:NAD(P)-binding Rossmann-fold superfamily protein [Rhynchospora pubera]|uniref:NAD(P)-binding Rossmann-fold superfamily protein n=1 Tax=Rhynchospora pubera TaxID=906938 RepID=A0AAV8CX20_9POAL|nr:NAD(P)-binding Rossmann-fold superfamily protein [Rhynchospora pubera]
MLPACCLACQINNGGDSSYILEVQAKLQPDYLPIQAGDLKFLAAMTIEPYEKAKECIDINYYGTKAMCEAFIPLLQLSESPRIVNVSSYFGKLQVRKLAIHEKKFIWLEVSNMTELLETFLEDFKAERLKESGWPDMSSAYTVSKVAVCAYTRILAKKYPKIIANSVNPGYVKTDINLNTGVISTEEGAKGPVMLALLPDGSSSGQFYDETELCSFE